MIMKKFVIVAATALAAASSTAAIAKTVTGTIANVDVKGDAITLADGKTLNLPEGIEVETLKAGEKVVVTYSTKSGKAVVSNIQPVK
jgi:Cu/Ag efflux protein CusF